MFDKGDVKTYQHSDEIFSAGDADTDFYMLVAGRIQTKKISRGGQKRILRTVQPGDTFALVSLFDHKPMFITAEVVGEEAKVFVIPSEDFMELVEKYSELARFIIDGLVRRIRRYGEAVTNMTVYTTEQRFIAYLFDLVDAQVDDPHSTKKMSIRLPDSVKTIAEQLGTVREVLSREISKMARKGWLEKNGQIVILKKVGDLRSCMEKA
jgi:CRP/FNR family cyclic AMP-dependent transcriptional regulator